MANREQIDEIVSKEALKTIEDLIEKLVTSEIAMEDLIKKTIAFNAELAKNNSLKEFNKAAEASKLATVQLTEEQKKLLKNTEQIDKAVNQLALAHSEEGKQIAILKVQKQQQDKANRDAAKSALMELDAYQKLEKEYKEAATAAKALAAAQGLNTKESVAAAQKAYELNARLKAIDKSVGDNKRNVGNYAESFKEAFSSFGPALGSLQNSLGGVGSAMQGLTAAGGGWLALIQIVIALINYIKQFDPIMDALEATFAGFNAAVDVVIGSLRQMWEGSKSLADGFKGLGDEMGRAAKKAYELKEAEQALSDAMVEQGVATASAEQRIAELRLRARNKSLSTDEKKKLLDEAAKLDEDNFNKVTANAKEELRIAVEKAAAYAEAQGVEMTAKRKNALYSEQYSIKMANLMLNDGLIQEEHRDAIVKAQMDIIAIKKESVQRQTDIQNKMDAADEKAATAKAARDAKALANEKAAAEQRKKLAEEAEKREELRQKRNLEAWKVEQMWMDARIKKQEEADKSSQDELDAVAENYNKELQMAQDAEKAKKAIADREKKWREEGLEKEIKAINKVKEYGDAVFDLISGVFAVMAENRKNELQEQIDKNEELKEAEIKRITASADSEQEKAAKIAVINARAEANRERLERKQKEADRRKAAADKAKALFEITMNTAVAVVAALKESIFAAIAAAAMGAAQLAIVAATPLPKYAKGTAHSREGLAIVGEEGSELMIDPSGRHTLTPDKPTLTYLKEGTRIIPHPALKDMALGTLAVNSRGQLIGSSVDLSKLTEATNNSADKITKAIKGQPILTRDGLYSQHRYNSRLMDYYKRNLR